MSRRRALAAGIVVVAAYVALAAVSGHLSPLARRPLLDGLLPQPYRWVNPPPDLASTNVPPATGRKSLALTSTGVRADVVLTPDNQATVIFQDGVIPAHGKDTSVKVVVKPLDPATLPPPGDGLVAFGNAYEISATYAPSETAVKALNGTIDVAMVYPVTTTLHATDHQLLSLDGRTWTRIETNDTPSVQQAEGLVPRLGDVVIAGVPSAASPSPSGSGGSNTLALALIVAAVCLLLVGVGLLLRSRKP